MKKEYLVLGTWIDKATFQPKTSIAPISQGTSKIGNKFALTNTDQKETIDGSYDIGEILTVEMELKRSQPEPGEIMDEDVA